MKKYTLANGKEINRIEYYDLPEATPRGRKMYWHSKPAKDSTPNNMNNTVEAVNGCFNFKIYFEEITQQQLNTLIWIISLGENKKDGTKLHKLGHARPLGYGSVKLQVVSQNVRKPMFNKENGNIEVELEHKSHDELNIPSRLNAGSKAEKCLLNLADFNYIPEDIPVMYPREKEKMRIISTHGLQTIERIPNMLRLYQNLMINMLLYWEIGTKDLKVKLNIMILIRILA